MISPGKAEVTQMSTTQPCELDEELAPAHCLNEEKATAGGEKLGSEGAESKPAEQHSAMLLHQHQPAEGDHGSMAPLKGTA